MLSPEEITAIAYRALDDKKAKDVAHFFFGTELPKAEIHDGYMTLNELLDEMEDAMKGMVKAELVEKVTGQAEVRHLYKVSKVGTIAGSYVTSGVIKSGSKVRVLRDGVIVYEGALASLKRFKDDAKEIKEGYECGFTIENFNDIKEGDIVEGYEMVEKE